MQQGRLVGGRYEVGRKIARGSTADLFEATDLERRLVVLKVLREGQPAGAEVFLRFKREAEAVAALEHPNVVRLIDFGTSDDGRPYLVMEHLVGHDLARELKKRGALPLEEAARILVDVCRAVDAAHEKGIVHRDLKPANVFLARVGKERRVKVLDFGIARLLEATDQRITQTQSLFGSPLYMAPEAFRSAKLADERSDVWSLGVMLYELLTGRVPFTGETPVAVGLAVMREDLVLPSTSRPELGRAVDVVIGRVLKKEPSQRYQTVRELTAALEVFLPHGRNDTMTLAAVRSPPAPGRTDDDDDVPTRLRGGDDPLDSPTRARPDITAQILAAAMPIADDEHEAPTHVRSVESARAAQPAVVAAAQRPVRPPPPSVPEPGEATLVDAAPSFPGPSSPADDAPPLTVEAEADPPLAPRSAPPSAVARAAPDDAGEAEIGVLRESNPNAESSRFANPVSVTTNPIDPVAVPVRRSPLLWVVPAVAVLFGVGGWWIGRSPSGVEERTLAVAAPSAPDARPKEVVSTSPVAESPRPSASAPAPTSSSELVAPSAEVAPPPSSASAAVPPVSPAAGAGRPTGPAKKRRFSPTQI